MLRCDQCKELYWKTPHHCAPEWEACFPGDDADEWITLRAPYAEAAAELAGEWRDQSGDYYLARTNDELIVLVRKLGESGARQFTVTAEIITRYSAEEVSEL